MIRTIREILILLGLVLLFLNFVHAEDFSFEIELTHYLFEDQEYNCTLQYDDEVKDFRNNKHGKDTESFDDDFENKIQLSCSRSLDTINLKIYHEGIYIETEKFTKTSTGNYEYILDYNRFKLKIDSEGNECAINTDGVIKDYDVHNDKISDDFFKKFTLSCEDYIDKLRIEVFSIHDEKFYFQKYENISFYSYDVDNSISKDYYTILYFRDDFEKNNKCTLTLDDKVKVSKTFTKGMKLKQLTLEGNAGESIILLCEYPISSIDYFLDDRKTGKELVNYKHINVTTINYNIKEILDTLEVEQPKLIIKEKSQEIDSVDHKVIEVTVEVPEEVQEVQEIEKVVEVIEVIKEVNITKSVDDPIENKPNWFMRFFSFLFGGI